MVVLAQCELAVSKEFLKEVNISGDSSANSDGLITEIKLMCKIGAI